MPPSPTSRPVRLVGIDVDGTLIGASGVVDARIWRAAERATAAGIHLALCSGRPAFGLAQEFAHRLDPDGWHLFQNGASIVHARTGESRSTPLPAGIVQRLVREARSGGRVVEFYGDTDYVVERDTSWSREHAALLGVPFRVRPLESLDQPVVRAQWLLGVEDAAAALAAADPEVDTAQSVSPQMPDARFIGITAQGVNKGSALRGIATSLGIALEEVMYVGDSGNDLSALRVVGHPVAMGNAEPEVRAVASHVVRDVEHAGLAEALELAVRGWTAGRAR